MTLPANETYQPRSSAASSSVGDEKQCRTTAPSCCEEPRARVVVGGARVDHDGLTELARERELRVEQPRLRVVRRVVAEVVEPGLADCDRLGMREQLAQLVEVAGLGRLVRMHAEAGVDAVLLRRRARASLARPRSWSRRRSPA